MNSSTYGVQQAVYQGGDPYTASGRITWEQLLGPGLVPSDEWAILLHVPSDSPKDAGLVVVDLTLGREMADLCLEIRNARRNKGLMSDAYPVEAIETAEDVETPTPGVEDVAATTTAEIVLDLIQAATAEVDSSGLLQIALVAFNLKARSNLSQVLFFKVASSSTSLQYAAGKAFGI